VGVICPRQVNHWYLAGGLSSKGSAVPILEGSFLYLSIPYYKDVID
jgi:hypothetical protein